jgi:hypothetical protein
MSKQKIRYNATAPSVATNSQTPFRSMPVIPWLTNPTVELGSGSLAEELAEEFIWRSNGITVYKRIQLCPLDDWFDKLVHDWSLSQLPVLHHHVFNAHWLLKISKSELLAMAVADWNFAWENPWEDPRLLPLSFMFIEDWQI